MEPGATPKPRESYAPSFFEALFKAEDRHFWFRARNEVIGSLVEQVVSSLSPGYRVLEVGCGTGNVLRMLEQKCPRGFVMGMDLFEEGLRFARQRISCPLIAGDAGKPPFAVQFDLIGMFDVLEHLEDDQRVLADLNRMLVPGGALLLTVPAHPELWSYFDVAACHCRRYRLEELRQKLSARGFEITYITEFMTALFPLAWVKRRLFVSQRAIAAPATQRDRDLALRELRIVPLLNGLMLLLLSLEIKWIARRRRLPLGTSILAVARKTSASS
jgi:SAM-dependent methyltransferase